MFYYFPNTYFKEKYLKKYFSDTINEKRSMNSLRYLLEFRRDKISFFFNNKKNIIKKNFYLDYLDKNPFKKKLDFKRLKKFLNKNIFTLFFYLKFSSFLMLIFKAFKYLVDRINKGKTIAIVGPDGVGKTKIIKALSKIHNSTVVYMGTGESYYEYGKAKFFIYDFIKKPTNNLLKKSIKFIVRYLFYYYLYIQTFFYSFFLGKYVFIDRHPSYDLYTLKSKKIKFLNLIFYKFLFFKPNISILIKARTDTILKRKNELSKKGIINYYLIMEKKIDKIAINEDFNICMKTILKIINEK